MIVLAFLVPLFILVSDLARDSAISTAEREAESLARVLSVLTVNQDLETAIDLVGEDRIVEVNGSVILPDGEVVGIPVPDDEDLSLAEAGSSFVASVDGGAAVYVPVLTTDGTTVIVRVFVPEAEMREGVYRSWAILAVLGVALVAIAAWVADRLGRSMTIPMGELSDTAVKLSEGDLSARVVPAGPPEIEDVGHELNRLAEQIGRLLQEERETAADLSHRLRTPLTATRLTIDGLEDGPEKDRLIADLDELQRTTDFIIREARRPIRREEEGWCDLGTVVAERSDFWLPLSIEQDRWVTIDITDDDVWLAVPQRDIEAVVDALIENAISHTPAATIFHMSVTTDGATATLVIEDAGQGFPEDFKLARGSSHGDSTGLGLDIVRRTVESSNGSLSIGSSESLGGAEIRLELPIAENQ